MRPFLLADLDRNAAAQREPRSRQIGVILSILFLSSLGTVATMMGTPAAAQAQADAQIALTALPSATAR